MDADLRTLRAFAAVVREGGLTRAAARLHLSQPALTKRIARLEADLGAVLFHRTRAGMTPTAAGDAFAAALPAVLDAWDRAERDVRDAAATASRTLRIGFLASAANERTQAILADFARRRPDWRVDLRQASWADPARELESGDVEAAFMRLPFPGQEHYHLADLLTEPRCLALASTHPLAGRAALRFADLLDEPFVAAPPETGAFRDHWLATEARGGRPARIGAVTGQPDEWLSAIASGAGIALAPESAARYYARPGVVYLPLEGVAPSTVALAWSRTAPTSDALVDFISAAMASAE
ncbi:LysR family transcriptional regulator [Glycomyces paridis]|uniref:LysR family transcriptional regulator n=1 Tax=Glycomyces paridis TaxID=2126555 RepID=A0A4S8P5S6_9ACTN|nr:LysR family transcriptional regulator [Glycomyces paridis]THV24605.1 LysR family transcriptional regulator [Glycomyces paridis]